MTGRQTPSAERGPRGASRRARIGAVKRSAPIALDTIRRNIFPQWLRTFLLVFIWLAGNSIYQGLIAPYVVYSSATTMTVGLAIFSGMAVHLWPSRTPQWRTVAWNMVITSVLGAALLTAGAGRWALMSVTVVGFGFVVLRANQNGRKLVALIRTWAAVR